MQTPPSATLHSVWNLAKATFLIGGFAMRTFRPTLIILSAMIAIAGLLRMSDIDSGVIFSAAIAPSIMLELFGSPLLAWRLVMSKNQKTKADG